MYPEFDRAFEAAPAAAQFEIGGTRFDVRADGPGYIEDVVAPVLAGRRTGPLSPTAGDVRVLVATGAGEGARAVAEFDRATAGAHAASPGRFGVHELPAFRFRQLYDYQATCGVQVMVAPEMRPDWDAGSPLRNFVNWGLSTQDRSMVHAGTLANRAGRGILLVGAGGSGKSGTVVAGVVGGLGTVGDDYVLTSMARDGGVTAEPVFRTLKQDPAGLARLGLEGCGWAARPVNWQGKIEFRLEDVTDADQPGAIEVAAIVLPRVTGTLTTTFEPMSAREGFLAMAPSSVLQNQGTFRGDFAFCARLARRLPVYRARLGNDADELAHSLRRFIDGLPG